MDFYSALLQHIRLSLLPGSIAILSGGGLGYLIAGAINRLYAGRSPLINTIGLLLPWRTLAMLIVIVAFFSPYGVLYFGLGTTAGMVTVGVAVFALALPFTVHALLEYWQPSPLAGRILAGVRTLLVVSVALAVQGSLFGAGGAGALIQRGLQKLDFVEMWTGLAIVAILALLGDLLPGILQLILRK